MKARNLYQQECEVVNNGTVTPWQETQSCDEASSYTQT